MKYQNRERKEIFVRAILFYLAQTLWHKSIFFHVPMFIQSIFIKLKYITNPQVWHASLLSFSLKHGPLAFKWDPLSPEHLQGTMNLTFNKYKYEQDWVRESTSEPLRCDFGKRPGSSDVRALWSKWVESPVQNNSPSQLRKEI